MSGVAETQLKWADFVDDSYRIYRSTNPANIRSDASSLLIRSETDTNAVSYTWTTSAEGAAAANGTYFYKVYGYRDPCGESDFGLN